ncbi:hypothetical protein ACFFQW_44555 [Umezawaea endophytica]|uniref:Uncharacterized protein n=1 Tax=Umezawaea endophytica TaxID=1654476 RepID=A0A9X3AJQ0_9PSEU|nr:hypothetical protein [Umezawaea endophytica]MCS7484847.1 hypothetical protein [Umezawaea endophytica]
MEENVATRYGSLGRRTALAARLVISTIGYDAIIALNTVHSKLGLRPNRAPNIAAAESPEDRWRQLTIWLFGALGDDGLAAHHSLPPLTVSAAEEQIVDKLIGSVGAFLLAESRTLNNKIDTWLAVEFGDEIPEREASGVAALRAHVIAADNAGQTLLRMVGEGTFLQALTPQAEAVADADLEDEVCAAGMVAGPVLRHDGPEGLWLYCSGDFPLRDDDVRINWPADEFRSRVLDRVCHELSERVVVLADFCNGADLAADLAAAWAEQLATVDSPRGAQVLRELVVTAVDGRQTKPIALRYGSLSRLRDDCRDAIASAMQLVAIIPPVVSSQGAEMAQLLRPLVPQVDRIIRERIKDVAVALAYAVDTVEPRHILVVSDLPASPEIEQDVTRSAASVAEFQEHLSRLREGSLSYADISVTVAPMTHPASPELWRMLCGQNGNLTLLDPQHTPAPPAAAIPEHKRHRLSRRILVATNNIGGAKQSRSHDGRSQAATRRNESPQGRRITVLVNVAEIPPRRVLAKASAAVVALALTLALVGVGAGFMLAGNGPGLPATIVALVGLTSGAAGVLWFRRTEAVTALSVVATAAASRVFGDTQANAVVVRGTSDVGDYRDANSSRSLV